MKDKTHDEIRRAFLDYFAGHDHKVVASYSLIPPADPTLLFVNAGMVQFKDVFTGLKKLPYTRATSSQKCLRVSGKHNDLENVGRTARHHTFFEMLGNFSFGDYFKREAIKLGYEFLVDVMKLDPERLWFTVFKGDEAQGLPADDEAYELWQTVVGAPKERILELGAKDNFWAMGPTGACGPCSELHYDQGPGDWDCEDPDACGPECECDRFLEIWNLVFMQYERTQDGELKPLPAPSIDTGMGLERLAAVVNGHKSNYDTDIFQTIIADTARRAGKTYGDDPDDDVALRVIADHARATAFLIADGIYPENEGRGYVLRRLMRRAIRFGRKLGFTEPFFGHACFATIDSMGGHFHELEDKRQVIHDVVALEEERFGKTLTDGLKLLADAMEGLSAQGVTTVPGDVVFTLYDRHGFPVDLTEIIAEEAGFSIDQAGFEEAMAAQRARGKASWKSAGAGDSAAIEELISQGVTVEFVGYDTLEVETSVVALVADGARVEGLSEGAEGQVVTAATSAYGESGGQVGDHGELSWEGGSATILDTTRPFGDLYVHHVRVDKGSLSAGQTVAVSVDASRRDAIRRNHSATHLLQYALRSVLGDHVKQRGSLVDPDRLRFDFSHFSALTPDEIEAVEAIVTQKILANEGVRTDVLAIEEALERGAIAFFEEKYDETVRMVNVAEGSVELCGGTHVTRTGDIGSFVITGESAISSGVRRVEALTGMGALAHNQATRRGLGRIAEMVGVGTEVADERVEAILKERKDLQKEVGSLKLQLQSAKVEGAQSGAPAATELNGIEYLVRVTDGLDGKLVRSLADELRDGIGEGVVALFNRGDKDKVSYTISVTKGVQDVVDCKGLAQAVGAATGGRGGGKGAMAQGGFQGHDKVDGARDAFVEALRAMTARGE